MPHLTLLWIIAGGILCLMEFMFPTAFVAFMMGVAALLVAGVSLVLPYYTLSVVLWLLFSTVSIVLSRRFFTPKRQASITGEEREGETITAIPAGSTGRVLYEGNSWRAKCADATIDIAPQEAVYIVRRQGNTLIVLPIKMLGYD
jgi:membrane protein implicated in regulation of membrane protease activity